jgi:hypothetical protein
MAAVIVARDRPADRAMGADAIADAIAAVGLAPKEDFTVIPPTPKDGEPDTPILPHTNLVVCNSSQLKDKIAADPTKVNPLVFSLPFLNPVGRQLFIPDARTNPTASHSIFSQPFRNTAGILVR